MAGLWKRSGLLQADGAAAEQKPSGGMNQTKEQIIPSPRMTCSSDPESASRLARLPQSALGRVRKRPRVVFHSRPTLGNSLRNDVRPLQRHKQEARRHAEEDGVHMNPQRAVSGVKSSPPPTPRRRSSICSCCPMCLRRRLLADYPT